MVDPQEPGTAAAPSLPETGEPAYSLEDLLTRPPKVQAYGEYDENGVDVSLLRYMLSLSPLERVQLMDRAAREALLLMEHGRRHREAQAARNR
jgi:hypothetical protein